MYKNLLRSANPEFGTLLQTQLDTFAGFFMAAGYYTLCRVHTLKYQRCQTCPEQYFYTTTTSTDRWLIAVVHFSGTCQTVCSFSPFIACNFCWRKSSYTWWHVYDDLTKVSHVNWSLWSIGWYFSIFSCSINCSSFSWYQSWLSIFTFSTYSTSHIRELIDGKTFHEILGETVRRYRKLR